MLKKQAKVLSQKQVKAVLAYLDSTKRNRLRSKVMFLLSLHGLRSKEIANLELEMITDAEGNISSAISLQDKASKGKSGRVIAMNKSLREALKDYLENERKNESKYVLVTERSKKFTANTVAQWFLKLYRSLGYEGCSSHSGRRTFITNCARKVSEAGGSIRDIQILAGHRHLSTTQRYIEQDAEAQRKLVSLIYSM